LFFFSIHALVASLLRAVYETRFTKSTILQHTNTTYISWTVYVEQRSVPVNVCVAVERLSIRGMEIFSDPWRNWDEVWRADAIVIIVQHLRRNTVKLSRQWPGRNPGHKGILCNFRAHDGFYSEIPEWILQNSIWLFVSQGVNVVLLITDETPAAVECPPLLTKKLLFLRRHCEHSGVDLKPTFSGNHILLSDCTCDTIVVLEVILVT